MKTRRWVWLCILVITTSIVSSCGGLSPIRIGYAATLTGPLSDLGVDGRDGAQLAIDTINASGGIAGRRVELIVRDDTGDPAVARAIDAALVQDGVVAVVGHITSGQTAAVLDQMNQARVVLFSPTASSDQFTGQDDFFFRVAPATSSQAASFAHHLYARGVRSLTGVYDLKNRAFAETFWQHLTAEFQRLGGKVTGDMPFSSGEADLTVLADAITATDAEAVVIVASAVDTALLAQYCHQRGIDIPLFASGWAQTDELLTKGGATIEGMELASVYNPENPHPAFQDFLQRFDARYRRRPAYAAAYSYDAVLALAQALEETGGSSNGLREALARPRETSGVQSRIRFDGFGDVQRDLYIATVKDGQFRMIATLPPVTQR